MPLDPVVKVLLDQIEAMGAPPIETQTPQAARALFARFRLLAGAPEPVDRVEDLSLPGPAGPIPVRLYAPAGPAPVLVYFHGGGWVIGDLDSHDGICRALCRRAGCAVVSVGYRLAPEHKFPAAVEDCYAATAHIAEHGAGWGLDPGRLAVGGDSAGGNLAAVVSLLARDRGDLRIAFQLLLYPATGIDSDLPSVRENGDGYFLTAAAMRWFAGHYLRGEEDRRHPHASPMWAEDHRGLPPALLVTAEFDPLRDDGEAYAARLGQAGVPVTTRRYHGQVHGFLQMDAVVPAARRAMDETAASLRAALFG